MKENFEFITEALTILCPNGWTNDNGVISTVSDAVPTKAELDAQVATLKTAYSALAYSRSRANAYDSVGNQLDQIMKDMRDGTTTHQTACEAVKSTFPKPE